MKDWYWVAAWAIGVSVLLYVRPKSIGIWNKVVSVILVTLLGLAAVVALYTLLLCPKCFGL